MGFQKAWHLAGSVPGIILTLGACHHLAVTHRPEHSVTHHSNMQGRGPLLHAVAEYLRTQTQTMEGIRLGQSGLTTLPDAKMRAVVFGSRMRMITAENLCKHRTWPSIWA